MSETARELIAIFTSCGTRDEAARISQVLVERRLVACAQLSEIESCYRWNDAIQHETEWRLWLKTTKDRYPLVEAAIRELHSHELPAIYVLPVTRAFAPYVEWVAQSVAAPAVAKDRP